MTPPTSAHRVQSIVLHEEVRGGHESDGGDRPAHDGLVDQPAIVRADVSADCGEDRHLEAEAPLYASGKDERYRGDSDGDRSGEHFQRVHLVDIVNAANSE